MKHKKKSFKYTITEFLKARSCINIYCSQCFYVTVDGSCSLREKFNTHNGLEASMKFVKHYEKILNWKEICS